MAKRGQKESKRADIMKLLMIYEIKSQKRARNEPQQGPNVPPYEAPPRELNAG